MKHFASDIVPTLIEAAKSNLNLSEVDFGGFLSESSCQKLEDYFCLLSEWTLRVDLVAVAEPWELFLDHGLDGLLSLAALEVKLPSGAPRRVLDVGSGSGLPGYLWAIARPDWKLTLCEPREKRVVFLKEVRRRLQLKTVQVHQSRLENVPRETFAAQDLLSFRALTPTEELLAAAKALLSETGYVVWLGGAEATVELSLLREVPLRAEYRIPGDTRGRQLVFLRP